MSSSIAFADVRVSGSKDVMTVQAKDASLDDIISAVNAALHVKITVAPASNIPITGTYSGPLRRVFARMLAGQDFILNSSGDRMTIILATQAGSGSVRRPAATNDAALSRANVAATDGDENTSGVQGWAGGITAGSWKSK
jgi:type II secretory pathway component GspD/PulD (secretin)